MLPESSRVPAAWQEHSRVTFLGHVANQWKKCNVPYMAIFAKYGINLIPNAHCGQPLGIENLQWVFQPHSGRNVHVYIDLCCGITGTYIPSFIFSSLDWFIWSRLNTQIKFWNMYVPFLFITPRRINKDVTYPLHTCRILHLYHGDPVLFLYLYSNQF